MISAALLLALISVSPISSIEALASVTVGFSMNTITGPGAIGTTASPKLDNFDQEPAFGGGEVRFLKDMSSSERESQQLSSVIRSADGKVIVVDGGVGEDCEHLLNVIKEMGGYVDAWLITHPQGDHVGALITILREHRDEIDIRNIYGHFLELEWYVEAEESDAGVVYVLDDLLKQMPKEKLHLDIGRGTEVVLSEQLSFRVLNDPMKLMDVYAINNSGLMYDVCLAGKHIIYLGDMGPEAGDIHMQNGVLDGVTADYVQMAHHGQNGVTKEFYEKLAPKACIWPTPSWLYSVQANDLNGFMTYMTRNWIDGLGIKENYCTKDGDVTLR